MTDNVAQQEFPVTEATAIVSLNEKLADTSAPGFVAELDPDEADQAGAFQEDALTEADALASTDDLAADTRTAKT